MRVLVWTVTIEGRLKPSLWMTHEGPETVREVEQYVRQLTEKGETAIVNLKTHKRRVPQVKEARHG